MEFHIEQDSNDLVRFYAVSDDAVVIGGHFVRSIEASLEAGMDRQEALATCRRMADEKVNEAFKMTPEFDWLRQLPEGSVSFSGGVELEEDKEPGARISIVFNDKKTAIMFKLAFYKS